MKITFFSTYLNHHQIPLCNELYSILRNDFKFIATKTIPQERINLGYINNENSYSHYSINSYLNEKKYKEAYKLALESDVVIMGGASDEFIYNRLKNNKLTFRYHERIFKDGRWKIFNPKILAYLYKNHLRYKNKKLYMLCASAYTAGDYALVNAYKNKCFKWGYFSEVKKFNIDELINNKKCDEIKLLWSGRFLDLKHPEKAIKVAKYLIDKGYNIKLNIIGNGVLENKIKNMIREYNLENKVNILGAMNPDKVRNYMEKSDIFLFTSDRREGWGVVLNEAMNSGCVVIADYKIGSVPYLIKNNINGFAYKNYKELFYYTEQCVKNKNLRDIVSKNAFKTIEDIWNPRLATERLIEISESIIKGKIKFFKEGPCSVAEEL